MDIYMGGVPRDGWTHKQKSEARELVNQLADELVAKIGAIKGDAATAPPAAQGTASDGQTPQYPTEMAKQVRADKRKRAEKTGARRVRRL
jgi:hypothetical protein